MSPLGLGFCADAETVGTQMVGRDNKNWIVGVKNNDKIWIRAPEKPVLVKEEPVLEGDSESEVEPKPEVAEVTEENSEAEAEQPKPEEKPVEKPKRKYTKKAKAVEPEKSESETDEAVVENKPEEKAEKPKRKYTKKAKAVESDDAKLEDAKPEGAEEKPEGEKPKRKYTKKTKAIVETDEPVVEKKAHAKRGPSGYNLFIGKKISELRQEQTGLKTTEYMKMAQDIWREMSKEEQTEVSKVLKEEHVAANA